MIPDFFERTFVKELGRQNQPLAMYLLRIINFLRWREEEREDLL